MENKPADKLQRAAAAREAFQAYEKAVEVTQQFIDAGPVSVWVHFFRISPVLTIRNSIQLP
jgi:hypothetical protein